MTRRRLLADQAAFLARWADYLSQRLDTRVTFVSRDQYQAVHDLLFNGQIDAAWTCGYPFVRFQSHLQLVAVPLHHGQPTYQSYLIRPLGDTAVSGWSALAAKVFAYSDPLSNSGWLVAQGEFAKAGIGQRDLKRAFFAHGHRNVADAVASRLADAGSIDGYVWETMKLQGMAGASQTEVIWKSRLHGFPPLVAAKEAEPARVDALRRSLLDMPKDDAGRALLKSLNLDGFIAGQAGLFDSIRQLARGVPGSGVLA
jgi:phosphonate transport system substrate-binding protein